MTITISDQFWSYGLSKFVELLFTDCCQLTRKNTVTGVGLEDHLQENAFDPWNVLYFQRSPSIFENIVR